MEQIECYIGLPTISSNDDEKNPRISKIGGLPVRLKKSNLC